MSCVALLGLVLLKAQILVTVILLIAKENSWLGAGLLVVVAAGQPATRQRNAKYETMLN